MQLLIGSAEVGGMPPTRFECHTPPPYSSVILNNYCDSEDSQGLCPMTFLISKGNNIPSHPSEFNCSSKERAGYPQLQYVVMSNFCCNTKHLKGDFVLKQQ